MPGKMQKVPSFEQVSNLDASSLSGNMDMLMAVLNAPNTGLSIFAAVRDDRGEIVDFKYDFVNKRTLESFNGADPTGKMITECASDGIEHLPFLIEALEKRKKVSYKKKAEADIGDGWFLFSNAPLDDDRLVQVWEDITDEKTTGSQLQQNQKMLQNVISLKDDIAQRATSKYQSLFNSIEQALCTFEVLFDENRRVTDLIVLETNPMFEKLTGINDAVGKSISHLVPNVTQSWMQSYGEIVLSQISGHFEESEIAPGRWLDVYAFSIDALETNRLAVLFNDITRRKALERRRAFILKLSDMLRPLADVHQIQQVAASELLEELKAGWIYYISLDADGDTISAMEGTSADEPLQLPPGTRISEFGESILSVYNRSQTFVSNDTQSDPDINEGVRESFSTIRSKAFISVPLLKNNQLIALLSVATPEARKWTEHEVILVDEVAQRTWAAIERARAEQELKRRERELAKVQEIGQVGGVDVDVSNQLSAKRSPEYLRLHGLPTDTISETHEDWLLRLHPHDRQKAEQTLFNALNGNATNYESEYRIIRPDNGETRWIYAKLDIEHDNSQKPVRLMGVHIDITRRKIVEEALRESEEKYRTIFTSIDAGFCVYDLIYDENDNPVDLEWVEVNPAYEKQTGLKDVAGKRHSELSPGTENHWFDIFDKVAKTGEPLHLEEWHQPTGRCYHTYSSKIGEPDSRRVGVLFEDITERKKKERQQAFLLQISKDLSELDNIDTAIQQIGEKIGRHFEVKWCTVNERSSVNKEMYVVSGWSDSDVISLMGSYRMKDYMSDELTKSYNEGKITIVRDTQTDPHTDAQKYAKIGVESYVLAPFAQNGEWKFSLGIVDDKARDWSPEEVDLLQDISSRIWIRLDKARAEEALRESEERLRLLIENLPGSAVFIVDKNLTYLLAEGEALSDSGFSQSDFKGKTLYEVLPKTLADEHLAYYEKVFSGENFTYEHHAHQRSYITRGVPLKTVSGDIYAALAVSYDITERKNAETALSNSEKKYRTVFNTLDEGFSLLELIFDDQGKVVDYWHREHNPAFGRMTGFQDATGKRMSQLIPELEPEWHQMLESVYDTGEPVRVEYPVKQLGQWYSAYLSRLGDEGNPFIICVYDDITDRKRQEQRQAYLLKLSDTLRPLADPITIQQETLRLLRNHLNAPRAIYAEALDQDGTMKIVAESVEPELIPMKGAVMRFDDFTPDALAETKQGNPVWREDIQLKDHSLERQTEYAALKTRSWIMIPLVKGGKLVAVLSVHHTEPHIWKPEEIKLIQETTERTWAAVELAQTQETLRDSERRFRLATEAADLATWEWDIANNQVFWNEQHFLIFGLQPQDAPVTPDVFFEHVHPEDRDRVDSLLRQSLADDVEFDTEFRALHEDGTERWMSGFGRVMEKSGDEPLIMSGVMFDITTRRQTEKDLHQIEERQKAIIESATDYAILTLDLYLRVRDWNAGAEYMMGYSEREILGQPGEIFFVPEDRAKGAPEYERKKAIQEGRAENERWHLRKDGSRFYGSGITSPLLDEAGNVIGLLKVMRDLTVQKKSEDALIQADKRKDEFLAMLAHELRNPISTVRNGLSILKITHQADQQVSEVVGMMDTQATHLIRMIDDLLDVSRVTQGKIELKLERLEVGALIANAVKAIEPQFEARRKKLFVTAVSTDLFIQGDTTRLSQVITNLLTNSLRYTGDDGQVWVSLVAEKGDAVIRVKDNGIGLSQEEQTSVFELFVQADNSLARSQGGLGIGLTLVRQLVGMHGGRAEAISPGIGRGSEFRVYLPLLVVPEQQAIQEETDTSAKPSALRILLIDDMEDLAKLTSMLLRLKGYEVNVCHNGREGVAAVETQKPAVVLCDIGMPELDGYQTAQLIREGKWGKSVILIALSGYGQAEDKRQAKKAGFDGHLTKPVDISEMQSMIIQLTEGHEHK